MPFAFIGTMVTPRASTRSIIFVAFAPVTFADPQGNKIATEAQRARLRAAKTTKQLARPSGGALDTATVLGWFLERTATAVLSYPRTAPVVRSEAESKVACIRPSWGCMLLIIRQ